MDKFKLTSGKQLARTREILVSFQAPRYTTAERDALTNPKQGQIIMNITSNKLNVYSGSVWLSLSFKNSIRTTDITVANTTTETTVHTSEIIANQLTEGKMYILTLSGKFSTANASDFVTMRFKLGGVTIFSEILNPKTVADSPFNIEFKQTIRTTGATGTYSAAIEGHLNDQILLETPLNGVVDTTCQEDITVTVQWSSANANNSFTVMQSLLEVIN